VKLRHLFEHVPVCILVADLTVTPAVILEINRRAGLVYGYTAAELVGKPAAHLVPDESRASLQSVLRRGETATAERPPTGAGTARRSPCGSLLRSIPSTAAT